MAKDGLKLSAMLSDKADVISSVEFPLIDLACMMLYYFEKLFLYYPFQSSYISFNIQPGKYKSQGGLTGLPILAVIRHDLL